MTYLDVSNMQMDNALYRRIVACVAIEKINLGQSYDTWVSQKMWDFAAQPGWAEKYASGGEAAITDADILAAVQALVSSENGS